LPKELAMPLDGLPTIPADSRRHQVVRALRDAIVTGRLRPGERLVERDISARMRASRGPVREALQQLELEGLVVSYPYRGSQVADISADEVEQVLVPIRLVLERYAVRHALPVLTEADLDRLAELVAEMRAAARADDRGRVVEADVRFHEQLLERADQPHCLQIWRSIVPRVRAYFHRDTSRHRSLDEVPDGHQDLLDALRTRDPKRVEPVLERHIMETFELGEAADDQ
jgi:DNA-binding GntR family transcriptional regulator